MHKGFLLIAVCLLIALSAPLYAQNVIATVNGKNVTADDFYGKLEKLTVQGKPAGLVVLDQIINEMLIEQLVKEAGVIPTEEQINKQIEAIRKELSLDDMLIQRGMTLDELKSELRSRQSVINLISKGVEVTDKEISDRYEQGKDTLFTKLERVEIAVIVCSAEESVKAARARLDKGEKFETVASDLSEDELSKMNGGKLGYTWKGQRGVPENLVDEAFKLKVGESSQPFQTQSTTAQQSTQWVIIKALDHKPQVVQTLAEVKEQIREAIALEKGQKNVDINALLQKTRKNSKIEIKPDRYKILAK